MQFEQVTKDERVSLPKPSIDTGMGLERIAAVLQGTHDNYETDLFRSLIAAIVEETGVPAEGKHKASNRVIADHLRASSFLIADGVLPSNEGRGYVLRRIMRRAMRHAELLGAREPLMWKLVPALVREMGGGLSRTHPRRSADHRDAASSRRRRFRKTLERGLRILDEESASARQGRYVSPATPPSSSTTPMAFPLDLTQDALKPRGIAVDTDDLQRGDGEASARMRARPGRARARPRPRPIWFDIRERVGRHRIPRLRHRDGGRRHPRHRRRRQGSRRARQGPEGRARPQPDAVLWRIGRPDRRSRRHPHGRRRGVPRHRYAEAGRRSHRPSSARSRRARSSSAMRSNSTSIMRGARGNRSIIRRRICCTRRCAMTLGSHVAQKGSLVEPGPPALRFLAQQGDERTTRLAQVEAHRQRRSCCRTMRSRRG